MTIIAAKTDKPTQAWIDHPRTVIAMLIVGVVGAYTTVVLPLIVSEISANFSLSPADAGPVAASEMIGLAIGAFLISLMVASKNRRMLVTTSAGVAIAANVLSALTTDFEILLATRVVVGIGSGGLVAGFAAAAGTTSKPDRVFAIFVAAAFIAATLSFRLLPNWNVMADLPGLFLFMAGLNAVALIACLFFPQYAPGTEVPEDGGNAVGKMSIGVMPPAFGLVGIIIFYMGIGGIWPLVPDVGGWIGIDAQRIAAILANGSLVAIVGSLSAAVVSERFGRRIPLAIGLGGVALSLLAMGLYRTEAYFAILVPMFLAFWNFVVPFLMGTLAVLDPSGRAVAFNMTLQYIGFGLGPILAGTILSLGGFPALLLFCVAASLITLAIYFLALSLAQKRMAARP